jgi:uncharacterized cupin superfamily protein
MQNIVNINDVEEIESTDGEFWGSYDKPLTPALEPRMGHLGVVATRIKPGQTGCPFHTHQLEDEVFFILAGRGVFRYGDALTEVKTGDCISCPAGSGTAHQFANPFDVDLVYLSIGMNDPNEVCTYPDSGKIMVRSLNKLGVLKETKYLDGEPGLPRIFQMASQKPLTAK